MFNIEDLNSAVEKYGQMINAPQNLLFVRVKPAGDGTPHVEFINNECFYVCSERGHEFSRKKIKDLDELMYFIFDGIITRMALDFELDSRVENKNCREIVFAKEVELMNKISNEWKNKKQKEIEKTLYTSPHNNHLPEKTDSDKEPGKNNIPEKKLKKTYWEKYFNI
jgi:hypothetical protein